MVEFVPLCGILMDQSCQKVHLVFKLSLIQLHLFHIFLQGVNLDSLLFEPDCFFLSILKYNLYIGIGILRAEKWAK